MLFCLTFVDETRRLIRQSINWYKSTSRFFLFFLFLSSCVTFVNYLRATLFGMTLACVGNATRSTRLAPSRKHVSRANGGTSRAVRYVGEQCFDPGVWGFSDRGYGFWSPAVRSMHVRAFRRNTLWTITRTTREETSRDSFIEWFRWTWTS